jgi:acyl-CoA thioester hydrolase
MTLPGDTAAPADHLTSRLRIAVRFCETDMMGIVHHANYLVYFEAGRVDWLHRRGISHDTWMKRDVHLPVVETRLRYRKAARFDETLEIATTCLELTRVTVKFGYVITRLADQVRICEGETLLACVGQALNPKRFPEDIAAVFRSAETAPSRIPAPLE